MSERFGKIGCDTSDFFYIDTQEGIVFGSGNDVLDRRIIKAARDGVEGVFPLSRKVDKN